MKASELEKGMIIKENGEFLEVVDIDHKTPGNLRAIYQITLKNLIKGNVLSKRFNPGDSVDKADLESKTFQYLYTDHAGYHFMDMETYESIALDRNLIGQNKDYLKENLEVLVLYHEHHPISVELPVSVDLKVVESAPGAKGDTSGRATKPAKLETGITVNVPLFIEEGEVIKIDTRNGQYLGRA
ncbi:MAG TPA: elongation factor P [Candidatus Omnitrophota bacterium]|nr:elongation factor P [Candidatus Omnitrophota bacterium]